MSLIGSTNEEKIWNYLKAKGLPDCGIAGLMGNLYAESCLIPTNLQNSYEKALSFTDAAYTAAVDNGTYQNFVKGSAWLRSGAVDILESEEEPARLCQEEGQEYRRLGDGSSISSGTSCKATRRHLDTENGEDRAGCI